MEFYPSSRTTTSRRTNTQLQLEPNSPLPPRSSSPHWPPLSEIALEPMFEKVVTPSDVGKLNRLVIPKQHAERFFPLDPTTTTTTTTSSSTTSTTVGGLLLSFEERRSGKPWRFRYSYWNSSQSYVMTKGWSRFVKEKHLAAGDTVSFSRSISDMQRLFIDWRRRPAPPLPPPDLAPIIGSVVPTWGGGGMLHYFPQPPIPPPNLHPGMYFRSVGPMPPQFQARMVDRGTILESVPVVAHSASGVVIEGPRRRRGVRLFGVDLDEDDQDGGRRRTNTELQLMLPQAMEEGRR